MLKMLRDIYKWSFKFNCPSLSQEPEEELEADPLDHAGQDQGLQEAEETEIETDRQGDAEIALQQGRLQLDLRILLVIFNAYLL